MGRKRWTPKIEDEIRRTIFEGQLDISGAVAPRRQILPPPPPPPVEDPKPDYTPAEPPTLF